MSVNSPGRSESLLALTIISLIIGVLAIAVAGYFGLENRRLQRRLRRFTWYDIEAGVKHLVAKIESDFQPDMIICSSAGSVGIVANLYLTYVERFIPLYMGVSKKREAAFASAPLFTGRYETGRWETFLPSDLQATHAQKILVLEDVVISGETLREIRGLLHKEGFGDAQIRTAAVFLTDFAVSQMMTPDYHWLQIPDTHFELPWGRSVGKGS